MDVMQLATQERSDLADLLETLTPEQWRTPSLCEGWTVHDVVAHVVSYEEHQGELVRRLVRAGGRPWRLNDVALSDYAQRSPEELVAFLRAHLRPVGTTAALGGRVGLTDALIHHQDIRRPLALAREVPPERLRVVLPFCVAAPPVRGFWHARGVRLVAEDVGGTSWSWGRGPQARGPAEAVLMALAGRRGAAKDLEGPGREILLDRLG